MSLRSVLTLTLLDLKIAVEVGLGIDIKRNTTKDIVHVLAVDINASLVAQV